MTGGVYVYTQQSNPLVGAWHEQIQFECASGREITVSKPLRELIFRGSGTFTVTWIPFEMRRDYWGTYQCDPERGILNFKVEGGNDIPKNMRASGIFSIDRQGRLILKDLWFGNPPDETSPANCGYRFERY